jgi:hypothetical protein
VIVTVGGPAAVTVTVAVAVAGVPPLPGLAVAVYVVVAAGVTLCVPPVGLRVYLLPSEPVRVTVVAFVATTVRVEEPPAETDAGLAVMVTVGAAATVTIAVAVAFVPFVPVAVAV